MPIEAIDLLKEGLDEVKRSLASLEDSSRREVSELRETMSRKHRELAEKVTRLESQHRFMLWITAPVGLVIGAVLRDIIGRWF